MKNKQKILCLSILFFTVFRAYASPISIQVCGDDTNVYPYWFQNENQDYAGVRVDLIRSVENKLKNKYKFNFIGLPWNRCLEEAKKGKVDAVLDASFRPERSEYLNYPAEAFSEKEPCSAKIKFYCGSYLVLLPKNSNYEYQGKAATLPKPIRVARGYSPASDLSAAQIPVEVAKDEDILLKQMLRDESGCIIGTELFVQRILKDKNYKLSVRLSPVPFKKNSYYFAFSKKTSVPQKDINLIEAQLAEEASLEKISILFGRYVKHTRPKD
jgi:polar amino acid transport system substrate-binding protein